ncbi:uncharacterized protein LACBIDRAFT_307875 [Laccaria bicolor S238N-H82]|uniref:Predicted protein n=1 Tax=Laccaria bicolor (strain S238N-H82 / ATCC MYA-4686) TaxID=486041 RepID=B0DQW7_LACBS|nr:uncharacterized protein LACBIDRAFT_307875 [Laccaria bicolor S238N-H82]EDR02959.1 predicted protein [Laccaria bicolor S238N-H82]|eukprot:XP_001886382.1 predicted protein [Laccaria bicolor S238N-H82]
MFSNIRVCCSFPVKAVYESCRLPNILKHSRHRHLPQATSSTSPSSIYNVLLSHVVAFG